MTISSTPQKPLNAKEAASELKKTVALNEARMATLLAEVDKIVSEDLFKAIRHDIDTNLRSAIQKGMTTCKASYGLGTWLFDMLLERAKLLELNVTGNPPDDSLFKNRAKIFEFVKEKAMPQLKKVGQRIVESINSEGFVTSSDLEYTRMIITFTEEWVLELSFQIPKELLNGESRDG